MKRHFTRREILQAGAAGSAGLGASALLSNSLIARALAQAPSCGSLSHIEHVVILIQENRSFDHYFGSYKGVSGFADPHVRPLHDGSGLSIFAQPGYPGGYDGDHRYPFHLDTYNNGECTNDINHGWGPQHTYTARRRRRSPVPRARPAGPSSAASDLVSRPRSRQPRCE